MKVKVNSLYRYEPNQWDSLSPCSGNTLRPGQVVRVINLPNAPKANAMGQCYVAHPVSKKFICMLSTGSLAPLTGGQKRVYNILLKHLGKDKANYPVYVYTEPNTLYPNGEYNEATCDSERVENARIAEETGHVLRRHSDRVPA